MHTSTGISPRRQALPYSCTRMGSGCPLSGRKKHSYQCRCRCSYAEQICRRECCQRYGSRSFNKPQLTPACLMLSPQMSSGTQSATSSSDSESPESVPQPETKRIHSLRLVAASRMARMSAGHRLVAAINRSISRTWWRADSMVVAARSSATTH